jgi:gliding motility-associated-like protein
MEITTANQNVIIHDTTAPVLVLNEVPADVTVECSAVPAASAADLTATDNCDANPVITYNEVKTNETCAGSYTLIRTWTATDASGNSSSESQTITVQDTTAPVFNSGLPADVSASCDDIPTAEIMTAIDACGSATVNLVESKSAGVCPGEYSLNRTWTASDACGNSASYTQKINVYDNTPPVISGTFQNMVSVSCTEIPTIPHPEFSDNCSGIGEITAPLSDDNIVNKTDTSYTIIRTWKVSDLCGNSSTFIQTINVMIKDGVTALSLDACNADTATVDLNSLIPQEYTGLLGIWTDLSSSGGLKGDNDGIFSPFGIPEGSYMMEYDINDPKCPRKIQITVNVNSDCKVLDCGNLIVHNFISPNGDGFNDVFTIDNIDDFTCYPTNRVRIFNRWGALLFQTDGYDNNEKVFRGISQAGATINQSAELPSGTYYYLLEYTADNRNYKEGGYLYLSR